MTSIARWNELSAAMAEQVEILRRDAEPSRRIAERLIEFVDRASGFAQLSPDAERGLPCSDHIAMISIGAAALLGELSAEHSRPAIVGDLLAFKLALLDVLLAPTATALRTLETSLQALTAHLLR
jgi:hypothetical protein